MTPRYRIVRLSELKDGSLLASDYIETPLLTPEGITYMPWTNGHAVGFKVTGAGRPAQYIYLNPSTETDEGYGSGTVFVYQGWSGDPEADGAHHYYNLLEEGEVV